MTYRWAIMKETDYWRLAVVLLVLVTAGHPRARGAVSSEVVLENARVAVKLDRESGGVRSVEDKETGEVHKLQGIGFAATTNRGGVTSTHAKPAFQGRRD